MGYDCACCMGTCTPKQGSSHLLGHCKELFKMEMRMDGGGGGGGLWRWGMPCQKNLGHTAMPHVLKTLDVHLSQG